MTQPTTSGEREAIARAVWNAVNGFWSVDATCDAILALTSSTVAGEGQGSSREPAHTATAAPLASELADQQRCASGDEGEG